MSTTIYSLYGGRKLKHTRRNNKNIYAVREKGSPVETFIPESVANKLKTEHGVKHQKVCDPNDPEGNINLQILPDGTHICVKPDIAFLLSKAEKKNQKINSELIEKSIKDNDLQDYIGPYMGDPVQKELLSHLLGTKNVDNLTQFNVLTQSKVVNTTCPPINPKEWYKTEQYLNPITGMQECRAPRVDYPAENPTDNTACPNEFGDPLAIEKYIDFYGKPQCRRPIISGSFSCPTPANYLATELKVLPDGTGVCIEPDSMTNTHTRSNMTFNLPGTVTGVLLSDNDNEEIVKLIKLITKNYNSYENVKELSHMVQAAKTLDELHNSVNDNVLQYAMSNNNGLNLLKSAVNETLKATLTSQSGGNSNMYTAREMMKLLNLSPDDFKN